MAGFFLSGSRVEGDNLDLHHERRPHAARFITAARAAGASVCIRKIHSPIGLRLRSRNRRKPHRSPRSQTQME